MQLHQILSILLLVLTSSSAVNLRSALNRITGSTSAERHLQDQVQFHLIFSTDGENTECSEAENHELLTVMWQQTQSHIDSAVVTKLEIEKPTRRKLSTDEILPQDERDLLSTIFIYYLGGLQCNGCFADDSSQHRRREDSLGDNIAAGVQVYLDSKPDFCMKGTAFVELSIIGS